MDETNAIPVVVEAPDGTMQEARLAPIPETTEHDKAQARRYLEARIADLEAELSALEGNDLRCAWYLAKAKRIREPSIEADRREHAAWLRYIATSHLRNGTLPGPDETFRNDLIAEMERLKAAKG